MKLPGLTYVVNYYLFTIMIKAIFWDNDGVLVDTEALYFQATQSVLAENSIRLTRDQFIRISLKEGRSVFMLASEQGMSPEAVAQLLKKRNRHYSDLLRNGTLLMDGVADTLSRLQNKVRMGIVTSCRREHFDIIHSNTDILPYFDFVLTQEDYKGSKPDPDPFLTAMKHCRLAREECLIVEDSERGLAAANAAGIHCIMVPNELTLNCDFTGAWRVVDDIREVVAAVLDFKASRGRHE